MKKVKCKRCGYKWEPKTEKPTMCPRCKTKKWDTKKVRAWERK